jgi:hypothetical protein
LKQPAKLDDSASLYSGNLETDLRQILTAYQFLLRPRALLILTFVTEITRHPELAAVLEFPKRIMEKC